MRPRRRQQGRQPEADRIPVYEQSVKAHRGWMTGASIIAQAHLQDVSTPETTMLSAILLSALSSPNQCVPPARVSCRSARLHSNDRWRACLGRFGRC